MQLLTFTPLHFFSLLALIVRCLLLIVQLEKDGCAFNYLVAFVMMNSPGIFCTEKKYPKVLCLLAGHSSIVYFASN